MGIKRKEGVVGDVAEELQEAVADAAEQKPEVDTDVAGDATAGAAPKAAVDSPVVVRPTSAVAVAVAVAKPNVISELADSGFEGLEINFTSFDTVILEKSAFTCSSGKKVKEDFEVIIQKTRNKYLFSSLHEKNEDREAVYSYNKHADTEEPEVMARIAAWKDEDGVGYAAKTYIEALVIMQDDKASGELNGEMMLLQIPPASIGKLSGHIVQNRLKGLGEPNMYTTIVGVGPKIGEGQTAFYPWVFSAKR